MAAFAAFEEHLAPVAEDDEATFFRGIVRRNLEEARQRLQSLEKFRLQRAEKHGPGVRAALAASSSQR